MGIGTAAAAAGGGLVGLGLLGVFPLSSAGILLLGSLNHDLADALKLGADSEHSVYTARLNFLAQGGQKLYNHCKQPSVGSGSRIQWVLEDVSK